MNNHKLLPMMYDVASFIVKEKDELVMNVNILCPPLNFSF